jgi:hypothetical protein
LEPINLGLFLVAFNVLLGFSVIRNNESINDQKRTFKEFQKQSKKYKRCNKEFLKSVIFFTLNYLYHINDKKIVKKVNINDEKRRFDYYHMM